MVALWLIGFEHLPHRSGEICVCEIFGRDVGPGSARIGMGVHPFADPVLVDDFEQVELPIDVSEPHDDAAVWTRRDVTFFVDGEPIRRTEQSPAYEMQVMLDIFELGRSLDGPDEPVVVERFRYHAPT